MLYLAQAPITRDQGLLQGRFSRLGPAATTGASPAIHGCSSRSPGPVRAIHHARSKHGTDRLPSVNLGDLLVYIGPHILGI